MRWPHGSRDDVRRLRALPFTASEADGPASQWRTPPPRLTLVPAEGVTAPEDAEREAAGTRRLMTALAAVKTQAGGRVAR